MSKTDVLTIRLTREQRDLVWAAASATCFMQPDGELRNSLLSAIEAFNGETDAPRGIGDDEGVV